MARTIRIGIIGYGGYGRFLINTWRTLPEIRIAAVAGRDRAGVEDTATRFGIERAYSGDQAAAELINDPNLDVIVITTPPADHARMTLAALDAGKHVFCEKPMAITYEDAAAIHRQVRRTGLRFAMGFVLRYDPLFERLKRIVEERIFGDLHRIDFENLAGDENLPADHWFWDTRKSGGILIEHGVHFFDIYSWIAGSPPKSITGHRTIRRGTNQEDRVFATVEYESGLLASFYHAFDRPARLERTTARLSFDRGVVDVSGWIALEIAFDAALENGNRERLDSILHGWIEADRREYPPDERIAKGGGSEYRLTERVTGLWRWSGDKQAVYEQCARDNLIDLLRGIDDPAYRVKADETAGLRAVAIAAAIPAPGSGHGYRLPDEMTDHTETDAPNN